MFPFHTAVTADTDAQELKIKAAEQESVALMLRVWGSLDLEECGTAVKKQQQRLNKLKLTKTQ